MASRVFQVDADAVTLEMRSKNRRGTCAHGRVLRAVRRSP
jgi:hypothetical protein